MENFVLYDEIRQTETSTMYKGRRKGSVNFVAIHCVDKARRSEVTNRVRLTHELSHSNIVEFYEWYETTNHLWLIVELCTGGSLELILSQDGHFPETAVRGFGLDLVRGLHHIHSVGMLFSDFKPSKILVDSSGSLKYDDFSLARLEEENLDDIFDMTSAEGTSHQTKQGDEGTATSTLGCPNYLAPEVLQGQPHSIATDLWSLGCLLYEMYTGNPPFQADEFPKLVEQILTKDYPTPKVKGPRLATKPTPDFCSLIKVLLTKDPARRATWHELVVHPFWQGQLQVDDGTKKSLGTTADDMDKSRTSFNARTPHEMKNVTLVTLSTEGRPVSSLKIPDNLMKASLHSNRPESRPQSSPDTAKKDPHFLLSSRPRTSPAVPPEEPPEEPPPTKKKTGKRRKSDGAIKSRSRYRQERKISHEDSLDVDVNIFTQWDLSVSPIIDNPKIQKPASLKYDTRSLGIPVHSNDKLVKMTDTALQIYLGNLTEALASKSGDKSAGTQRTKLQLLNYVGTICGNGAVAKAVAVSKLIPCMINLLKTSQPLEIRCRSGRMLGLLAQNLDELPEDLPLTEVVTALTEVLRDNNRNSKLKQSMVPAIGELLFLAATHDQDEASNPSTIPALVYTMISRCLREGEDAIVQHFAAKVVENVAATNSVHGEKLSTNEIGHLLWQLFTHSMADTPKICAISALCRICRHSFGIFQSILDKVGLPKVLEGLAVNISRVQQALVTMFGHLLTEGSHVQRTTQDKEFCLHVMKLVESPSVLIRAKALLVVLEIIKVSPEMIMACCQARLITYMERDIRQQMTRGKSEGQAQWKYMDQCLTLLSDHLVNLLPQILGDAESSLAAVSGRKHPSTIQAKQLKGSLPLVSLALHLITSQVFRPRIVGERFLSNIGALLTHVKSMDCGETNIEPAIGMLGIVEFNNIVLSILEAVTQHPSILMEHHVEVIDSILNPLAALVASRNDETRMFCVRLFAEIMCLYLNHDNLTENGAITNPQLLTDITSQILPSLQQLLLDADPVPLYGLKLILALIETSPDFIRKMEELELVPVLFQVLIDHRNSPTSSTIRYVISVLNCLVADTNADMEALYDQGIQDHISILLEDVERMYLSSEDTKVDSKALTLLMIGLLDLLHTLLKHIACIVRNVLQAKKSGGSADTQGAERILMANKPVVSGSLIIIRLLCHKDKEIHTSACECLSLLGQLYGGEYPNSFSADNSQAMAKALQTFDTKRQKLVLRYIKRVVSTETHHIEQLNNEGAILVEALGRMRQTASSHADVAVSSLAADILRVVGVQ
ncbi:serine/threonine-protein kinase ULK4 [Strongylocentrotus purpuratus]|uniref:Protein kinase domain-containing protein n=1 Tax=Strongylocentrotus purpuratus TaxID=7668 RepID=A0A7M7T5W8_STRPU|nr:serine/threonine-protein kinase ULK4 [Strongylocentrotus purpuratus]XP_030856243.1 serine/threonine-protein kinase ULK4 [Strongylocentrotus purpuratus]